MPKRVSFGPCCFALYAKLELFWKTFSSHWTTTLHMKLFLEIWVFYVFCFIVNEAIFLNKIFRYDYINDYKKFRIYSMTNQILHLMRKFPLIQYQSKTFLKRGYYQWHAKNMIHMHRKQKYIIHKGFANRLVYTKWISCFNFTVN